MNLTNTFSTSRTDWAFYGVASLYLLLVAFDPATQLPWLKAAPVLLLTLPLLKLGKSSIPFVAALCCSALGDILLATNLEQSFVYGLAAFFIAHLCYLVGFALYRDWQTWKAPVLVVIAVVSFCLALILWPQLGELSTAVAVYILVICLMSCSALIASRPPHLLMIGAGLFMLSDSLIAINKFLQPFDFSALSIMASYYGAQWCLARGVKQLIVQRLL